ncbi:hypothetical protein RHGRI_015726 [Rhododendron griersonianum]|uniref:Uncharacterized protein n=1 Tax=Rhododendron griersonianum TaxID=479676 RepID=A0AAV6JS71_9ERIC|nr:hypothetical protein RHGRI_015726 [Rhododendron griersonianum]
MPARRNTTAVAEDYTLAEQGSDEAEDQISIENAEEDRVIFLSCPWSSEVTFLNAMDSLDARKMESHSSSLECSLDLGRLVTTVVDAATPVDWVKINVRETKGWVVVYAAVPGLLHEQVCSCENIHEQVDSGARSIKSNWMRVITDQPEQPDNPGGITAFERSVYHFFNVHHHEC